MLLLLLYKLWHLRWICAFIKSVWVLLKIQAFSREVLWKEGPSSFNDIKRNPLEFQLIRKQCGLKLCCSCPRSGLPVQTTPRPPMAPSWQALGRLIHSPSGERETIIHVSHVFKIYRWEVAALTTWILLFLSWLFSRCWWSLSLARCEYGMVPLGTGVANCLGDDWSEVLDTCSVSQWFWWRSFLDADYGNECDH